MRRAFRVTHWAFLTAFLYAATLLILWWPLLLASFFFGKYPEDFRVEQMTEFYTAPETWMALSMLALLQGFFLLVPLQIERGRPVSRRRWALLAAVAALMMGLLVAALGYAVGEAVTQEPFLLEAGASDDLKRLYAFLPLVPGLLAWAGWGWLFWRYARAPGDDLSRVGRVLRWLLRGSTAELLVAVPCHVYVRHKDYCCAGANTFVGLGVGLAVLLFAFGPGVFFLFVGRARELRKAQPPAATARAAPPARWGGRARDVRVWCVVGLAFFLFCRAGHWLGRPEAEELATMGQAAFLVLWCAAVRDVWRGAHEDEDGAFEAGLIVLACFPVSVWTVCQWVQT
jgi:hypothetical protein